MTKLNLPSYEDLHQALLNTSLKWHASQAHGLITGILCGHTDESGWEKLISGEQESTQLNEILRELYNSSQTQLDEFSFDFKLILPDDEYPLQDRAEALTLWCQGFLTGLKMAGVDIANRDPSELTEAINDIIDIAKMNFEEVIASEEDEMAYSDLVEYVRMAVVLIYQEIQHPEGKTGSASKHLH